MAERVCPWWLGYLLASPIRRWFEKPEDVLAPHIGSGATALDVGCAMGFFSLPLAELVGPEGRVICVDLQERMVRSLRKRAARAGLADRIETRVCSSTSLGLGDLRDQIDFALAYAMVHEVPDAGRLLVEIGEALAPGGRLLIAEPRGHVSEEALEKTIGLAEKAGLSAIDRPDIKRSRTVLLERPRG